MHDRIPPVSLEAEQALIGAMMADPDHVDTVTSIVASRDFYAHSHEFWAAQIFALHGQGRPVDQLSVAESVRSNPSFEKFGGMAFLATCAAAAAFATPDSVRYYAELVAEKSELRAIIAAGSRIAELGFDGEADLESTRAAVAQEVATMGGMRRGASDGSSMREAMLDVYRSIESAANGDNARTALMTPWATVNEMTGGFHPGELVTIPSAPGQGKTGMSLTLADWFGAKYGMVALISLEMNKRAISRRLVAMHANVSARNQKLGTIADHQWERIGEATSVISRRGIRLFGRATSSLNAIRRELRALKREQPIRAVIIDHAGFVADAQPSTSRSTEHERLDQVYRRLLEMAEEFETVIFAIQHVNRAGSSSKPSMFNIRGGGNIEGHSHTIIAPYREFPDDPDIAKRCIGEFHVLKCRDGDSGIAPAWFIGWRHLWLESKDDPLWFHFESQTAVGAA